MKTRDIKTNDLQVRETARLYKICRATGLTAVKAFRQAKIWISAEEIDTNKIQLINY